MDAELTLPLAFLAGLAGAGHCWTMCGGLVGGVFLGCNRCNGGGLRIAPYLGYHASYHVGRVLAYTALGALAAGIGQAIVLTGNVGLAQAVLYCVAGVGVVLAGAWMLHRPLAACAMPTPDGPVAQPRRPLYLAAGLLNGLMPCALVFSLTLKAASAPSIIAGASWLFAFGAGTVPAMALAGALAHGLGGQALVWLRRAAAMLVMGLGLQAIWAGAKYFQVMLHL